MIPIGKIASNNIMSGIGGMSTPADLTPISKKESTNSVATSSIRNFE